MGGHWWSRQWSGRPWWSKWHDVINFSVIGVILLIVLWESLRRWLGY
jgi:hypothetical protein